MTKPLAFDMPHTDPDTMITRLALPPLDDVLCGLALIGFVLAGVLA